MAEQTPVLNADGTHVWLRNPDTGGVWACPVDVAEVYVNRRGWEYADAPDTSLDGLFDAATPEGPAQTGFDPAEHNLDGEDGVNAYLAKAYEAGALGEIERVLALEAAGKNRVTIVDPRDPVDDPDSDTGNTPNGN